MNIFQEIFTKAHIIDLLIVVIGILIALFINNLNDERKRKKRIKIILEIIKENLTQDLEMINKEILVLEKKSNVISKILKNGNIYDQLSVDEKFMIFNFLFAYPPHISVNKEGYYLLKDADFDYDIKDQRILSDILNMYEKNILNIERELDRSIRTTEMNSLNHIQDNWTHSHLTECYREGKISDSIEESLKYNLGSSEFINEIDYTAKLFFGPFWSSLEKYKGDIEKILKVI